jgi:uncharacterized protein YjeT (DUF2065 family)
MKIFLYAVSLLCIATGCCTILYTSETRHFLKRFFNEVNRKILSVFEVAMGVLLLVSATASQQPWFIRLIGLLAVIEGVLIFLLPKNLYDELVNWYVDSASGQTYRLFGILSLILGSAMLTWVL